MSGPIVYARDDVELRFEPIMLNGKDGALMLVDAADFDEVDFDEDDLVTFQNAATAAAWIADLVRAARAAGIDLRPAEEALL